LLQNWQNDPLWKLNCSFNFIWKAEFFHQFVFWKLNEKTIISKWERKKENKNNFEMKRKLKCFFVSVKSQVFKMMKRFTFLANTFCQLSNTQNWNKISFFIQKIIVYLFFENEWREIELCTDWIVRMRGIDFEDVWSEFLGCSERIFRICGVNFGDTRSGFMKIRGMNCEDAPRGVWECADGLLIMCGVDFQHESIFLSQFFLLKYFFYFLKQLSPQFKFL
jgi:hypothetical protein